MNKSIYTKKYHLKGKNLHKLKLEMPIKHWTN